MQWTGDRALLTAWHEKRTGQAPRFSDNSQAPGSASVLFGDEWHVLKLGEWLLWSDDEFLVMDDELFTSDYEAME
jgi:hypothetical protein